jgi:hypothetical protein
MRGLRAVNSSPEYSVFRCIMVSFVVLIAWHGFIPDHSRAFALEQSVLRGKVSGAEGKAVEGARVFVYRSDDVRKPADFISDVTDKDGLFRMVLPPGKYWSIARLKKTEGYGPLMPGDKHSGEPREIELALGREVEMDFIITDLTEAIRIKTKERVGPVKISGRVIDGKGSPVPGAYAFANRNEKVSGIPDYLSAWVDSEGRYALYVPRGRYYLGGAVAFPPGQDYFMNGEIIVEDDKTDADIIVKDTPRP